MRLLGQREHTRVELERKLRAHAEDPGALAQALDELEHKGYLNEQRAADSLVHRRSSQYGAARLRQEMQDKGLARELIEETLAGLKDSELPRAREVWRRRFGALPQTPQERARQARFLQARGFALEVVRRVLGNDPGEE